MSESEAVGEEVRASAVRLSVGVPTYNHAPYLPETIDSLLAQTVPPREIVICDNHSTDGTAEILAGYAEEHPDRVRVVSPPEHLPMMANWNYLLGRMTGEWSALLSSDDLALPCYVETLAEGILIGESATPRAVLARGAVELMDADGEVLRERKLTGSIEIPPQNFLDRVGGPKVDFGAAAWPKRIWEEVGGFPEDFRLAGDWAFWLRLCPHGSFITRATPIARYRRGHRSAAEELSRRLLWAEDFRRIYTEVVPEVAEALGGPAVGVRDSVVRHARRMQCHKWLRSLSRKVPLEDRGTLAEGLERWARDCGVEEFLERFRVVPRMRRPRWRALRRWAATRGIG
ncbi:MAG: glycosyltransferase family 2 protein [Planctomycetota bacterium]